MESHCLTITFAVLLYPIRLDVNMRFKIVYQSLELSIYHCLSWCSYYGWCSTIFLINGSIVSKAVFIWMKKSKYLAIKGITVFENPLKTSHFCVYKTLIWMMEWLHLWMLALMDSKILSKIFDWIAAKTRLFF